MALRFHPPATHLLPALRLTAAGSLLLLFLLCLAWELWLAPLRPGGSLIALKALPLLLPFRGILDSRRYSYQWSSMLILAYFAEGATRAWSETGAARSLAIAEIAFSLVFFASALAFARLTRPPREFS